MSKHVNERVAQRFASEGRLIGKCEPCEGSKGTWWQVYELDGEIVACVFSRWGVSCGDMISREELGSYVDDADVAMSLIDA